MLTTDLEKNTNLELSETRGEMGSLLLIEQFMLIEHIHGQVEQIKRVWNQ